MINCSGQVATFNVALGNFTKQLDQQLMTELRAASAEWVKAVLQTIPVYTGSARGTFAPISRVLKHWGVNNPTVGPVDAAAAKKIKRGFYYKNKRYILGYTAAGIHSNYSFNMITRPGQRVMKFNFTNNLPYVLWNTMYKAPDWLHLKHITPTYAYEKGAIAFEKYVKNVIPTKLPSVAGYLTVQIIRIK